MTGDGDAPRPRPRGLLNPYVQLALGAILVAASELLLKRGADATIAAGGQHSISGLSSLGSVWVWAGIACYIASFVSWLHVLRHLPLVIAFNLMNSVHVLIPVGAWLLLGESINRQCRLGIGVVVVGLIVLSKPIAALEERL